MFPVINIPKFGFFDLNWIFLTKTQKSLIFYPNHFIMFVRNYLHISAHMFMCKSVLWSLRMSVFMYVLRMSVIMSVRMCIHMSVRLIVHMSERMSDSEYIFLFISIGMGILMSACMSIRLMKRGLDSWCAIRRGIFRISASLLVGCMIDKNLFSPSYGISLNLLFLK